MNAEFKFKPIVFSWVAIHPKPVGIIQFIGGAFFGTFPTVFYRYLFRQLFESGYTIIARPFRFTFRHWSVAISLLKEQVDYNLLDAIAEEAEKMCYDCSIYREAPTSKKANYFWLGHSLGCKYIALLEVLSELENKGIQQLFNNYIQPDEFQEISRLMEGQDLQKMSLLNQPSILMAPAITGLESAVPFQFLVKLLENFIQVKPTVEETRNLIKNSNLFSLTSLISFNQDKIAKETVDWLIKNLPQDKFKLLQKELSGGHLSSLDFSGTKQQVPSVVVDFVRELGKRL